jgi:hypothetical protein
MEYLNMLLETLPIAPDQSLNAQYYPHSNDISRLYGPVDSSSRYFSPKRIKAQVHLHSAESVHTSISGPEAEDRAELEQFIHSVFRKAYDADVREFMPQLMSLRNAGGELLAVCGLRHAENVPLFLERYLPDTVETVIAEKTGQQIDRAEIVEIGNLAVAHPETVRSLLASISVYLHGTGTTWGVFTGIPTLRNSLKKLNMDLLPLGLASLSHLPQNEQAAWGRYYDEKPHVMAVKKLQPPTSVSAA